MSLPKPEELLNRAISFTVFDGIAEPTRTGDPVIVERRFGGMWSVVSRGVVLSGDGFWEYQSMNSNRTESFKRRTRFSLEKAWELAEKYGNEPNESYQNRIRSAMEKAERRKERRKLRVTNE